MLSKIETKDVCFSNNNLNFTKSVNIIISTDFSFGLESRFTSFRTFSNKLLLIYADINNNLIFYDLEENRAIKKINSFHNENISLIYQYNNFETKEDFIATISGTDFTAKIWNVSSFKLIANLENIYHNGVILSSCFINYNNNIYLALTNSNNSSSDKIKIININNNNEIIIIDNNNNPTVKIVTFSNKKITFIIVCNEKNVISYSIDTLSIFQKYIESGQTTQLENLELLLYDNEPKLMDYDIEGKVRIWDFYSSQLKIKVKMSYVLKDTYVWNKYLIISNLPESAIFDLNNLEIINRFAILTKNWRSISIIDHVKYGKCLLYLDNKNIGILYN